MPKASFFSTTSNQKKCYARLAEDYEAQLAALYFYLNPDLALFVLIGQTMDWVRNSLFPSRKPQIAGQSFTNLDFMFDSEGEFVSDEAELHASFYAATDNYLEFILSPDGSEITEVSRVFRFDQEKQTVETLANMDAAILRLTNAQYQEALENKLLFSQLPKP